MRLNPAARRTNAPAEMPSMPVALPGFRLRPSKAPVILEHCVRTSVAGARSNDTYSIRLATDRPTDLTVQYAQLSRRRH
jgi:hypothetical protein